MLRVAFIPADHRAAGNPVEIGEGSTPEVSDVASRLLIDVHGKRSFQGGLGGRGAWLHARPQCIGVACAKGFSRAFKEPLKLAVQVFYDRLREVAERQLEGLVLAAWRSRRLVYGGDAVKESLPLAPLGVLATDARSVAKEVYVQDAAQSGKMLIWSTKAELGKWLGRSEVGVMAVMDVAIATAMRRAIALSSLADGKMEDREFATADAAVEVFEETHGVEAPRKDESSEVR